MSICLISKYPLIVRFTDIQTGEAQPDVAYIKKCKYSRHRVFMNLSRTQLDTLLSIFDSYVEEYDRDFDRRISVIKKPVKNSDSRYRYTFVVKTGEETAFNAKPWVKTFDLKIIPQIYFDEKRRKRIAITPVYQTPKSELVKKPKVHVAVVKEKKPKVVSKKPKVIVKQKTLFGAKSVATQETQRFVKFTIPNERIPRQPEGIRARLNTLREGLRRNPTRKARFTGVYTY